MDGRISLRLYSVSCPRDGERPNTNNLSLTVKREPARPVLELSLRPRQRRAGGPDRPVRLHLPHAERSAGQYRHDLHGYRVGPVPRLHHAPPAARDRAARRHDRFFGARSPDSLPYFGPLNKVPDNVLKKHLVFSRMDGSAKEYVQDRMRAERHALAEALRRASTHIYICGLKAMEAGVEQALDDIASGSGLDWTTLRDEMRDDGRYHVETY